MKNYIVKILSDDKSSGVGSGGSNNYNLPKDDSDDLTAGDANNAAVENAETPTASDTVIDGYQSQINNNLNNLIFFAAGFLCCSVILKYVISYSSLRKRVYKPPSSCYKR